MKNKLTIGQFSKLMNISSHNIRYYEKEGLLSPSYDDNGYRAYDIDDAYLLSMLLLLRENNIAIKDIKTLLDDYRGDRYRKLLKESQKEIDKKIDELSKLKEEVDLTIKGGDELRDRLNRIEVIELKDFSLDLIDNDFSEQDLNIQYIYNLYKRKNINTKDIFKEDIYFYIEGEKISIALGRSGSNTITFKGGKYINYLINVERDEDLDKDLELALTSIYKAGYRFSDDFLVKLNTRLSMFVDLGEVYELLVPLKNS